MRRGSGRLLIALALGVRGAWGAAGAAALEPALDIARPGAKDPRLLLKATWHSRLAEIPLALTPVEVTGPEELKLEVRTDLLGRARLDPGQVLIRLKGHPDELTLTGAVQRDGRSASKQITLTRSELKRYYRSAAEAMNEEGKKRAQAGDMDGAAAAFRQAERLDPSLPRSYYNEALALEKQGQLYSAAAAYTQYLGTGAEQPQERLAIKRKVIDIAKKLVPAPKVPPQVKKIMLVARDQAKKKRWREALYGYEQAQVVAPWWPEPYYSAGLVYEHLSYRADFSHQAAAARNFRLFLAAAPKDKRRADVEARIEKLERLDGALHLPPVREKRLVQP